MYQWNAMNVTIFKFKITTGLLFDHLIVSLSIPIFSEVVNIILSNRRKCPSTRWIPNEKTRNVTCRWRHKQYLDNIRENLCQKQFDAAQRVEQTNRGHCRLLSQKRYDTGGGTCPEMNDAELALTQAKLSLNQSICNYMNPSSDNWKSL